MMCAFDHGAARKAPDVRSQEKSDKNRGISGSGPGREPTRTWADGFLHCEGIGTLLESKPLGVR